MGKSFFVSVKPQRRRSCFFNCLNNVSKTKLPLPIVPFSLNPNFICSSKTFAIFAVFVPEPFT